MGYSTGSHTIFHHRYHIVWAPKYRFKVLHGGVRTRVRDIIRQVCASESQIRSLMATPPCAAIESTNHANRK